MNIICGTKCQEIYELYDLINNLGFKDESNYEKYIELISKRININKTHEKINEFCLDEKFKEKPNNAFKEKKIIRRFSYPNIIYWISFRIYRKFYKSKLFESI